MTLQIPVKRLLHGEGLPLPGYASPGAAGLDLSAAVKRSLTIQPGETSAVPTGIAIAIPDGLEGQVRPRSGLALKYNVGIINAPGTIDSDYRGEILVLLTNFSREPFTIRPGDRIAQLVITRCERVEWLPTEELPPSGRGEEGFGHSGR